MITSLLLYFIFGTIAGLSAGLFGVGGGLVIVPLLASYFQVIGIPTNILMHIAIGTSLAAMVITTFFSGLAHHTHGGNVWPTYKKMVIEIVIGAFIGAVIADVVHSTILSITFGIFCLVTATLMISGAKIKKREQKPKSKVTKGYSLLTGIVSSLLGIGAGTMGLPFLTYYQRVSMHDAIGISALLSFSVALVGSLTYFLTGFNEPNLPAWSTGYLYWPAILGISIGSPFFAWYGAKLARQLSAKSLKTGFAIFLYIVGIRMLFL